MAVSYIHLWMQKWLAENVHRLSEFMPAVGELPAGARLAQGEFIDAHQGEARADVVVLFGDPPTLCLLIEVQRRRDSQKPDAWLRYTQQAVRAYGCPVRLIVLMVGGPSLVQWVESAYASRRALIFPAQIVGRNEMNVSMDVRPTATSIGDCLFGGLRSTKIPRRAYAFSQPLGTKS